ncbi:UNVERIFIED_ORG: hypothetical protein BTE55_19080 [Rhizobium sophorae]
MGTIASSNSLIPVHVTGIQPPRVRAVNNKIRRSKESPAPKDLGALDSCDEHRNEGGEVSGLRTHPDGGCVSMPGRIWREGQPHPQSSQGLTRGSILLTADGCGVDARVKPEHDGEWGGSTLPSIGGAAW